MSAGLINMHSESVWVCFHTSGLRDHCDADFPFFFPWWPGVINSSATDSASLSFHLLVERLAPSILPPSTRERFSVNHLDYSGIHNQSTLPLAALCSVVGVCRGSQEGSNYVRVHSGDWNPKTHWYHPHQNAHFRFKTHNRSYMHLVT